MRAGQSKRRGATFAALLLALCGSAPAFEFAQLQALPALGMIDATAAEIFARYGVPRFIALSSEPGQPAAQAPHKATWQGKPLELSAGDWVTRYTNLPAQAGIHALFVEYHDGFAQTTIRRAPQRTTFEVPADPLLAHRAVAIEAFYRHPVAVSVLVAEYGQHYERVVDPPRLGAIRYWVPKRSGDVPLSLYAVDFLLDATGDAAYAVQVRGRSTPLVQARFQHYFERWEENLND